MFSLQNFLELPLVGMAIDRDGFECSKIRRAVESPAHGADDLDPGSECGSPDGIGCEPTRRSECPDFFARNVLQFFTRGPELILQFGFTDVIETFVIMTVTSYGMPCVRNPA